MSQATTTIAMYRDTAARYRRALVQIRDMTHVMLGEPATDAELELAAIRAFEAGLHHRMRAIARAALNFEEEAPDRGHAVGVWVGVVVGESDRPQPGEASEEEP